MKPFTKKLTALSLTAGLLLVASPSLAAASGPDLRILFSHHREGSVEPCG